MQKTHKRADGAVSTKVSGRITATDVKGWSNDFAKLKGRSSYWIFDGAEATAYSYDAVRMAVESFSRLRQQGLSHIIAYVPHPLVRMGASVVKLSLRQLAQVELLIVNSLDEAEQELDRLRTNRQ